MDDAEFEARCNRLTGSLDAIRDLLETQVPGLAVPAERLAHLIDLVATEAHILLDDPKRPRAGLRVMK